MPERSPRSEVGILRLRKFDHDLAKRMRKGGMTYAAIARELGVSDTAVQRVCDPRLRNSMYLRTKMSWESKCVDCGARCTFNRYSGRGKGRCRECAAAALTTTVRDDGLLCTTCREWKWDTEFHHARNEQRRRGRHKQCRVCATEARREWAKRNPEKYAAANHRSNERRRARRAAA